MQHKREKKKSDCKLLNGGNMEIWGFKTEGEKSTSEQIDQTELCFSDYRRIGPMGQVNRFLI